MKLFYILVLTLPLLTHSYPAQSEDKSLSLEEVELSDSDHAATDGESQIQKRSGSFDYVAHLKSGLLSSIGQASASIASGSSGGSSSSGGDSYKSYESAHGNSVEYNPWSFKKSVLNTIFQAVKAITGGVTALKGQLIKGSGYALSASGNLVAASGDKVTDVGKAIINSAQISSHGYGGAVAVHPFAKFSSFSGASSGGSSGTKHTAGPVVHTETITTYEIPPGHSNYGPPSKPPTYSSATHQYLPPATGGYSGGGAPFSSGHAAFEAPASNYLPTGYAHEGNDDFNIYGRHQKLSEADTRKAAAQLQEILSLLPNGKTEFTASKTVVLDTHNHSPHTGPGAELTNESVDLHTYGLQNDLGPLESLSHTESITAAYGQRPGNVPENAADIYHQMAKKQTAEEIYIQKHPNEGYDYRPTSPPASNGNQGGGYHYNNYHATNSALKDLTPIIAALEVAKRRGSTQANVSKHFAVEKSVYKVDPRTAAKSNNQLKHLPPSVQKTKHIYFDPAQKKADNEYRPTYVPPPPAAASGPAPSTAIAAPSHTYATQHSVAYAAQKATPLTVQHAPAASSSSSSSSSSSANSSAYKVRRQVPPGSSITALKVQAMTRPYFKHHDYEIHDPLMFNRMLSF